jgi:hypothetical protein
MRVLLFAIGLYLLVGAIWSAFKPLSILLSMVTAAPVDEVDMIVLPVDIAFTLVALLLAIGAIWGAARIRPKNHPATAPDKPSRAARRQAAPLHAIRA